MNRSSPAVVTRDESGRATVRAIRLTEPLHLDGKLDEDVYRTSQSVSDFVQQVPREGAPATERTESWVMFDRDTLYIAARCWDSAPPERWIANELRRESFINPPNSECEAIAAQRPPRRRAPAFAEEAVPQRM